MNEGLEVKPTTTDAQGQLFHPEAGTVACDMWYSDAQFILKKAKEAGCNPLLGLVSEERLANMTSLEDTLGKALEGISDLANGFSVVLQHIPSDPIGQAAKMFGDKARTALEAWKVGR